MYRLLQPLIDGLITLTLLGLLIGCSTSNVKKQHAFYFSNTSRIEIKIMADDDALLPDSVVQHVNENLTESGYPVGAKVGQIISHTLIVRVGSIVHSSTPAGFSFAIGNADPRALDFQKTDVLPVNCTLTAITHPEQVRDLDMNFTASATDRKALAKDKLTDHISTVCFNLLTDVTHPPLKTRMILG